MVHLDATNGKIIILDTVYYLPAETLLYQSTAVLTQNVLFTQSPYKY